MKMNTPHPSTLTVAILVIYAVALATLLEIGVAVCASATIFVRYGLFWTFVLLPFLLWRPSRIKSGFYAALVASLLILYVVPWNSRKPFLRDLEKVEVGMTMADVETIMGRYMKGTEWPAWALSASPTGQPTEVGSGTTMSTFDSLSRELVRRDSTFSMTYRHSTDGAFNSDWGVLKFKEGRVIAKKFLPD